MKVNAKNVAHRIMSGQDIVPNVDLNSILSARFAVVRIGTQCSAEIVGRLYLTE